MEYVLLKPIRKIVFQLSQNMAAYHHSKFSEIAERIKEFTSLEVEWIDEDPINSGEFAELLARLNILYGLFRDIETRSDVTSVDYLAHLELELRSKLAQSSLHLKEHFFDDSRHPLRIKRMLKGSPGLVEFSMAGPFIAVTLGILWTAFASEEWVVALPGGTTVSAKTPGIIRLLKALRDWWPKEKDTRLTEVKPIGSPRKAPTKKHRDAKSRVKKKALKPSKKKTSNRGRKTR